MGQGRSKERYENAVKKLSSLELANIEAVFNEISTKRKDGTRHVELSLVNRQDFAERFRLPGFIAERLFHAFDRNESGTIDLEEFIGGIALCLHGTIKDKCRVLFHIFNLAEDDGVSKDELTAVLLSSLESAQTILDNVEDDSQASKEGGEADKLIETVTRMVADAFETCRVSRTGKLSAKEFENWLYRNPKIMDNVFGWQCPCPEEGHWMNESSPEPSPSLTLGFGEPDDSVQSVDIQGVPAEQIESRTLSDLFSSSSTTGHDKEGQSFFDSLVAPNDSDTFPPIIHQPPHFSREFLPSTKQTFQQPAQLLYDSCSQLLMENTRQSLQLEPQQFFEEKLQPSQEPLEPAQQPPHDPGPLAEVLKDPLQLDKMQKPAVDPFLGMDLSKEPSQLSAPPTPEGEWVRSKQTEAERRHSAWISPPQTKQFLVTIGSGMLNPSDVDQQFLTAPGLVIEESQIDPVTEFLNKFGGEQEAEKRKTLTVDSVPLDESGLRELLAAQCWRAGLEFTTKFLTAHGQGLGQKGQRALHTHKTLQVWFCRIALLFKLRMYSTAEVELEAFGNFNQPDLFYEFYPDTYPGRKGSMVPFALRVLHAELPQYLGRPIDSLDNLYDLQRTCRQVLKNLQDNLTEEGGNTEMTPDDRNAAIELWISRDVRVLCSIGNCFLSMRDYSLAVTVFESIIERDPSYTLSVLSGIGRIYLQLGDLENAQSCFKYMESKAMGDPKSLSSVVINKGLLAISKGSYEEAHRHFLAATKLDPNNSTAVNNVAVCLVYIGKLPEARSLLETTIWKDPNTNLYEVLLYNLCTIYDVGSSQGLQNKKKLFEYMAKHRGYGLDISYFKIA